MLLEDIFFQKGLGVFFRYSQFLFIGFHFNSNNLLHQIKGHASREIFYYLLVKRD